MGRSLRANTADRLTMRRRNIVAWLGCAGASPWPAMAQRRGTVYRIGIIGLSPTADIEGAQPRSPQVAALRVRGQPACCTRTEPRRAEASLAACRRGDRVNSRCTVCERQSL